VVLRDLKLLCLVLPAEEQLPQAVADGLPGQPAQDVVLLYYQETIDSQ
jgi:hypothetical protein